LIYQEAAIIETVIAKVFAPALTFAAANENFLSREARI